MNQTKTNSPSITLSEWASNVEAKKRLNEILADPVMQVALDLLSRETAPTTTIQRLDGVSFIESVALTNVFRAGAHKVIQNLKSLPFVVSKAEMENVLGKPYEWLGSAEDRQLAKAQKDSSE